MTLELYLTRFLDAQAGEGPTAEGFVDELAPLVKDKGLVSIGKLMARRIDRSSGVSENFSFHLPRDYSEEGILDAAKQYFTEKGYDLERSLPDMMGASLFFRREDEDKTDGVYLSMSFGPMPDGTCHLFVTTTPD